MPHLQARDTTLLLASRAPLAKLIAYRERMGWGIDWVSSGGSDFNRDLGSLYTEEELKPFLESEIPPSVEQNARMCGTDVVGYVSEGPGLSAYAPVRFRTPHALGSGGCHSAEVWASRRDPVVHHRH